MATIREATPADLPAVRALLQEAALPVADLQEASIAFLVAEREGAVVGAVGLERHASTGLLRSLVVAPGERGQGTGDALAAALEAKASSTGISELVLLTQTAAPFFARRGYSAIERAAAPEAVQASAEFRSLCPASATCMVKPLAMRKRVLFVCVENSNRSQMAEAFARIHGGTGIEAVSAGSRPSGRINPKAIRFMAEIGYDLGTHASKSLDEVEGNFDAVVTMGCGDSCPWVPARRREDWALPDPKDMDDDAYRAVRDGISGRVRALLASL